MFESQTTNAVKLVSFFDVASPPQGTRVDFKLFKLLTASREETKRCCRALKTSFHFMFSSRMRVVINSRHSNHGNPSVMSQACIVFWARGALSKQQVIEGCRGDLSPPRPARRRGVSVAVGVVGRNLKVCYLSVCLSLPLHRLSAHC